MKSHPRFPVPLVPYWHVPDLLSVLRFANTGPSHAADALMRLLNQFFAGRVDPGMARWFRWMVVVALLGGAIG